MVKRLNIPYGRQQVTDQDIKEVERVLRSDFLTQGPEVPKFEENFKDYVGSSYSVAVNSATSGLHLSCLALNVGKGDIVWTSAVTFVASANCALYCGAKVDLIDIDKDTCNISIEALRNKLKAARKNNTLPKVLVAVHLAGLSCEMDQIKELSDEFGFRIIEDASHASGGSYKGKRIGACQFSDISVFSFHPVKNLTSGEGGMITTNSEDLYIHLKGLREHGINKDPKFFKDISDGPWYYEQIDLGYNYRMTDIHAVLGSSQLKRLSRNTKKRHEIAEFYKENLERFPLILPPNYENNYSGMHLYVVRIDKTNSAIKHEFVFSELRRRGIGVNLHYIPVYRHPYFKKLNFDYSNFPNSEEYYSSAISIPMYPSLSKSELSYVVDNIEDIFN